MSMSLGVLWNGLICAPKGFACHIFGPYHSMQLFLLRPQQPCKLGLGTHLLLQSLTLGQHQRAPKSLRI